jgi:hypothetical protein
MTCLCKVLMMNYMIKILGKGALCLIVRGMHCIVCLIFLKPFLHYLIAQVCTLFPRDIVLRFRLNVLSSVQIHQEMGDERQRWSMSQINYDVCNIGISSSCIIQNLAE